jgi:hypothetical protein
MCPILPRTQPSLADPRPGAGGVPLEQVRCVYLAEAGTHAICDAMAEFELVAVEDRPRLYGRLLRDLASELLPERRLRLNPRVVKRKMSNYKLKREEHAPWPQPTVSFCQVVALI